MKRHNERKEMGYRDEEREVIERGQGSRKYPEYLQHATWQHWANEKHTHIHKRISKEYDDMSKHIMGWG